MWSTRVTPRAGGRPVRCSHFATLESAHAPPRIPPHAAGLDCRARPRRAGRAVRRRPHRRHRTDRARRAVRQPRTRQRADQPRRQVPQLGRRRRWRAQRLGRPGRQPVAGQGRHPGQGARHPQLLLVLPPRHAAVPARQRRRRGLPSVCRGPEDRSGEGPDTVPEDHRPGRRRQPETPRHDPGRHERPRRAVARHLQGRPGQRQPHAAGEERRADRRLHRRRRLHPQVRAALAPGRRRRCAAAQRQRGVGEVRRHPVRGRADHQSRWPDAGRQDAVLHRFARPQHGSAVRDRRGQRHAHAGAGRRTRRRRRHAGRPGHGQGAGRVRGLPAR